MALTNDRGIVTRGMLKAFWDRFKNLYASVAHSHGNITSGGTVTASGVAIANNDTLLIVDNSDSSKIKKTALKFDGATTTSFLSQKGTWETPSQSTPGNGMLKFEFNDTGLAGDVFSANQTGDAIVSMAGGPIHYGEGGDKTTPDGFQYYSPGTIRFNGFPVMVEGGSDMVLIGNVSGGTDGSFTVKTNKETKTISVGKPAAAGTADKAVADGDGNTISSTYVTTSDSRLTDARTPTAHNQASNTITAMTGYAKASSAAAISASDSLNSAIGKLEKVLDGKGSGTVTQVKVGDTAYNPTSGVVSLPAYPSVPGVVSTSANGLAPKVTDTSKFLKGDGTWATPTDTKNTAGSTDSSSKLFLIGATSQAANPQTYSHDTAYVGTDGCLYSNSTKVSVEGHTHSGYAVSKTLTDEDLNSVTTPGFYNSSGSNSIQNTPKAGDAFGLWVTKNAGGTYYSQYYEGYQGSRYVRQNQNGTWGAWTEIKYTDTVTTVTNNLTSTSTTAALSAAQGKALNDKFGSYLPLSGGTVTGTTVFSKSTDASGTANNSPALIVGGTATTNHIEIDDNEIICKSNGTTLRNLYLNECVAIMDNSEVSIYGSHKLRIGGAEGSKSGGCVQSYNASTKALEFTFN